MRQRDERTHSLGMHHSSDPAFGRAILSFAPVLAVAGMAAAQAPSVTLTVDAITTRADIIVAGGQTATDFTHSVMRLDGGDDVLPQLFAIGSPLLTVEQDPVDPDAFAIVIQADLTGQDIEFRVVDQAGGTDAVFHLAAAGRGNPCGIHMTPQDFQRDDWATGIAFLRPGWVRVNHPKANNEDNILLWTERFETLRSFGIRIQATIPSDVVCKASSITGAPWWDPADLAAFEAKTRQTMTYYADFVDAWQLDNELAREKPWDNTCHGSPPSNPPTAWEDRGEAYGEAFGVFYSVVTDEDPSATAIPFGFATLANAQRFRDHFLTPLEASLPPGELVATFDQHKHDGWQNGDVKATFDQERDLFVAALVALGYADAGEHVQMLSTESSTWEWSGGIFSGLPLQTDWQMATHLVLRNVTLREQGALFTGYSPLVNRLAWQGDAVHKFTKNGHYPEGQPSDPLGTPKMAGWTAARLARLSRTAGWAGFDRTPGTTTQLLEVTITRGTGNEAGVLLASKQPTGIVIGGSTGDPVWTSPRVGVVHELIVDGQTFEDAGSLVRAGETVTVTQRPLWVEWLD